MERKVMNTEIIVERIADDMSFGAGIVSTEAGVGTTLLRVISSAQNNSTILLKQGNYRLTEEFRVNKNLTIKSFGDGPVTILWDNELFAWADFQNNDFKYTLTIEGMNIILTNYNVPFINLGTRDAPGSVNFRNVNIIQNRMLSSKEIVDMFRHRTRRFVTNLSEAYTEYLSFVKDLVRQ